MSTVSLLRLASTLYGKLQGAHPKTRERIEEALRDVKASGAIPLGIRKTETGTDAYWWVVYDATRFPSENEQWDYLRERTPPGYQMIVLTV